ncbi:MAG: class I SAM-dependent RNA methyltransferase [Clostridiales bacterium]|nr:class I SAM-dependent RNA methyltransferase [Clostridiales bacterium]
MKKGQIMEGTIERVDFPNKGIVRTDEGIVTVKNTIPGQNIRFSISKKRSGRAEGRLLEVLQPSELETRTSACGKFPACGGCTWQSMSYEDQLSMKASQVKRLLEPVLCAAEQKNGDTESELCVAGQKDWDTESELCVAGQEERDREPELYAIGQESGMAMAMAGIFEGIRPSPQEFQYRNKMEFSFGDEYKDGPLSLGLHKRGSHYDVLTVSDCQLVHPDMTAILTATLDFFRQKNIPYYHKMTHEGILRHLLLRRAQSTGEVLVCLVTAGAGAEYSGSKPEVTSENRKKDEEPANLPQMENLTEQMEKLVEQKVNLTELWNEYTKAILSLQLEGRIAGILHMRNNSVADVVQSEQTTVLYGQDYFYETLLGLRFKITPFSFFQTNSQGAEVLYSVAREFVIGKKEDVLPEKANVIFDLYSGTGTIAQILAPIAKKVIGVEIVEEAVAAARENAVINGLDNCTFIAGDVLKVLDTISDRPDFIVLDPPRDGIHPKALQKIIAYGAPRILYISCKPTSLARDLEVLLASGYQAERICCVDMFPQTANIETVVQLSKGEINSKKVRVEFSLEDMDMSGFQKGSRGPGDLGFEPTGAETYLWTD